MNCDPNVAQAIIGFSIAGVTLRVAIAWIKKKLKLVNLTAFLGTLACCVLAVLLYMAFKGWDWTCFIYYVGIVFISNQTAYRVSHKPKPII